jgi:Protein of unknown function (DUF1583)
MPRFACRLILLLLAALIAPPLTGAGSEPGAEPEPGTEYHEYYVPLTSRPENLPRMQLVGPNAETCVRFEPAGMRITLPPGFKGSRPQVGLSTGLALKGDFEATVDFEVLELPEPADAGPETTFCLWASRVKPDKCIMGLSRRMVNQGPQFAAWVARFDEKDKPDHKERAIATEATTGRLRLARRGGELSYYVAEGTDGDFALLHQTPIGEQDLHDLMLVTYTHNPRAFLDGRFRNLRIRMGSLPRSEAAPEKQTRPRRWLWAAVLMGVILLLLIGLTFFLRRRRSGVVTPHGTPPMNPSA